MKIIIGLLLLITLLSYSAYANMVSILNFTLSSGHYTLQKNIKYGKDKRHKLDIYHPNKSISTAQGQDKPVIVFVYGGAWKQGRKKDYKFIAHAFTKAGYRVVIADYRLFPQVKFPDFIDDVADAIAYIDQNAKDLLGDVSAGMVLMGHSAGAHTAATLATDSHYLQQRKVRLKLRALVALSGPYDLQLDDPEVIPIFLPVSPEKITKPARLVHANMPPVLLLHGRKDTRVKPFHTEHFAAALQQAGIEHRVIWYQDIAHIKIVSSIAASLRFINPTYSDIIKFLDTLE